jgi:NAD(P)-dependent dehydrogenase (short-subunit alcohol dehydrogenase family)
LLQPAGAGLGRDRAAPAHSEATLAAALAEAAGDRVDLVHAGPRGRVPQQPCAEDRLEARVVLRRIGDPVLDIGPAVAVLGSDLAYVTGQTLVVDGGDDTKDRGVSAKERDGGTARTLRGRARTPG